MDYYQLLLQLEESRGSLRERYSFEKSSGLLALFYLLDESEKRGKASLKKLLDLLKEVDDDQVYIDLLKVKDDLDIEDFDPEELRPFIGGVMRASVTKAFGIYAGRDIKDVANVVQACRAQGELSEIQEIYISFIGRSLLETHRERRVVIIKNIDRALSEIIDFPQNPFAYLKVKNKLTEILKIDALIDSVEKQAQIETEHSHLYNMIKSVGIFLFDKEMPTGYVHGSSEYLFKLIDKHFPEIAKDDDLNEYFNIVHPLSKNRRQSTFINFIFAFVLVIVFSLVSIPTIKSWYITDFGENKGTLVVKSITITEQQQLKVGDAIWRMGDVKQPTIDQFRNAMLETEQSFINVSVLRDGKFIDLTLPLHYSEDGYIKVGVIFYSTSFGKKASVVLLVIVIFSTIFFFSATFIPLIRIVSSNIFVYWVLGILFLSIITIWMIFKYPLSEVKVSLGLFLVSITYGLYEVFKSRVLILKWKEHLSGSARKLNETVKLEENEDDEHRQLILGKWRAKSENEHFKFVRNDEYFAGSNFHATGNLTLLSHQFASRYGGVRFLEYEIEGQWHIKAGLLSIKVNKSNCPELYPVGNEEVNRIIQLGERNFVEFIDGFGEVYYQRQVDQIDKQDSDNFDHEDNENTKASAIKINLEKEKEARRGNISSIRQIATTYLEGAKDDEDYQKAFHWFRTGAFLGDGECQYQLGQMLENGNGRFPDFLQALAWYLISSGSGHELATKKWLEAEESQTESILEAAQGKAHTLLEISATISNDDWNPNNQNIDRYILQKEDEYYGSFSSRQLRESVYQKLDICFQDKKVRTGVLFLMGVMINYDASKVKPNDVYKYLNTFTKIHQSGDIGYPYVKDLLYDFTNFVSLRAGVEQSRLDDIFRNRIEVNGIEIHLWKDKKDNAFESYYPEFECKMMEAHSITRDLCQRIASRLGEDVSDEDIFTQGFNFVQEMNQVDKKGIFFVMDTLDSFGGPVFNSFYRQVFYYFLEPNIYRTQHIFSTILGAYLGKRNDRVKEIIWKYHQHLFYEPGSTDLRDLWSFDVKNFKSVLGDLRLNAMNICGSLNEEQRELFLVNEDVRFPEFKGQSMTWLEVLEILWPSLREKYGEDLFSEPRDSADVLLACVVLFWHLSLHTPLLKELVDD